MIEKPTSPDSKGPPRERPTPGAGYAGDDASPHISQMIFDLQGSVGELKEATRGLQATVSDSGKSVGRIKLILAFAAGVVFIASGLTAWFVDNRFDEIIKVITKTQS